MLRGVQKRKLPRADARPFASAFYALYESISPVNGDVDVLPAKSAKMAMRADAVAAMCSDPADRPTPNQCFSVGWIFVALKLEPPPAPKGSEGADGAMLHRMTRR
jgi:hypothetical protein